jgi:hypothetical protein
MGVIECWRFGAEFAAGRVWGAKKRFRRVLVF